jgi:hypothetical protein
VFAISGPPYALRFGCALGLAALGCGRAAVDTDSIAKPASGAAASTVVVSAPSANTATGTTDMVAQAGVWSIAELKHHRDLAPEQVVSLEGVLIHSELCYPCPADVPCAPCGSFQLLGVELNSPRADAVGFDGSLMSEHAAEFQVGGRYVFTGTLKDWDERNIQPRSFATFRYLSHHAID